MPSAAACLCLLMSLVLGRRVQSQQPPPDTSNPDWQTITNLTVPNSLVNYQIKSFTIDHTTAHQISLIVQQSDAELVKDLIICDNVAYTITPTTLFVQPLNPRLYSPVGLYGPRVLHQLNDISLNTKKSLAYDAERQILFFTSPPFKIMSLEFCTSLTQPNTLISRDADTQITHLDVDMTQGVLVWVESDETDHFRIMKMRLDDHRVNILHETNSSRCSAMTLFADFRLVFWVTQQQLWSMPYHRAAMPGEARLVLQNGNLITDSIQIDHKYLYWSSMQRKVLRLPLADASNDKVQLISQLGIGEGQGPQHLLLAAFRVTSIIAHRKISHRCSPLCTQTNLGYSNFDKGAITEMTPSNNISGGQSFWTEIHEYEWRSPKKIANLVITVAIVLAINSSLWLICTCFRRRQY